MNIRTGFSHASHFFAATAVAGTLIVGLGLGSLGMGAAHAAPAQTQQNVNFTLVAKGGTGALTVLTVQERAHGPEYKVTFGPSSPILRRFYGNSNLKELSAGDHLLISGDWSSPHVFTAVGIVDTTIQVGYSQINGKVTSIGSGLHRLVVQVTANEGKNAAFAVKETVTLDVSPTTKVELLGGHMGTIANLRPGTLLTCWGLSNRNAHAMFSPHDITQILSSGAGKLTKVAPPDSTPQ